MDLLHAVVLHQKFGKGEVVQLSEDVISVSFPKPYGKKKFIYPTVFHHHLTLEDEALSSEMKQVIKEQTLINAAKQKRIERSERIARFCANAEEKAAEAQKPKAKKKK